MARQSDETSVVWRLARRQHGVISRGQLLDAGLTRDGITHRVRIGRLHRIHRGVFAVGRADLTRNGRWMAALLACPSGSVLSHESAVALWGIEDRERTIVISIPAGTRCRVRGARIHCRKFGPSDRTSTDNLPVTAPTRTLLDLATVATERRLEAAVNAADKLGLIDPESLRLEVERRPGIPGVPALRRLLDATTFALTDSELERRFIPIARSAGLPMPETGARIRGYRLDFLWRDLGLVVETDGLRYHRTAGQQARDRRRDQILTAAGLTVLRFTHAQVVNDPEHVRKTLVAVAARVELTLDV